MRGGDSVRYDRTAPDVIGLSGGAAGLGAFGLGGAFLYKK